MTFTAANPARVGVLISGRGSNLAALVEAAREQDYPARIAVVISNRPGAGGLDIATEAGIPVLVVDHKTFDSREEFDAALTQALQAAGVDIVCNAGFMRLLTAGFIERWRDRHLNIHPSLLPAYKGLHVHERAIAEGVRISGCTVHVVREEMDEGPIVAQAAVAVRTGDTPETLAARVLAAEHRLYPHALAMVASGRARVVGERVVVTGGGPEVETPPLFVPALQV